jgi:hypothetical protein
MSAVDSSGPLLIVAGTSLTFAPETAPGGWGVADSIRVVVVIGSRFRACFTRAPARAGLRTIACEQA